MASNYINLFMHHKYQFKFLISKILYLSSLSYERCVHVTYWIKPDRCDEFKNYLNLDKEEDCVIESGKIRAFTA